MEKHNTTKKKRKATPDFRFRCTAEFKEDLAAVATLERRSSSALAKKLLEEYVEANIEAARAARRKRALKRLQAAQETGTK